MITIYHIDEFVDKLSFHIGTDSSSTTYDTLLKVTSLNKSATFSKVSSLRHLSRMDCEVSSPKIGVTSELNFLMSFVSCLSKLLSGTPASEN